jgi:hypothetical protein
MGVFGVNPPEAAAYERGYTEGFRRGFRRGQEAIEAIHGPEYKSDALNLARCLYPHCCGSGRALIAQRFPEVAREFVSE